MLAHINRLLLDNLLLSLLSAVRLIPLALVAVARVTTLLVERLLGAMNRALALLLNYEIGRAAKVGVSSFHLRVSLAASCNRVLANVA